MSTSYYYIREPFTSVRLEEGPGHDRVTLWERGANCGTLVLSLGSGKRLVSMFAAGDDDDSRAPIRTHYGGKDVGAVVTENVSGLDPSLVLISEYGEPLTVEQIRARAGHGKNASGIGGIGELFGYDPTPDDHRSTETLPPHDEQKQLKMEQGGR